MYQEFNLDSKGMTLQGYHWEAEHPKAVLCLLHGIGEHAGRYDKIGMFFRESQCAMVAVDLRGHGKSPGKRGHAAPREALFEDIDALVAFAGKIYPDAPIYLYGHSMGGNIGLDYRRRGAGRHRLKGYIITAPWLTLYNKLPAILIGFARVLSRIKPDFLMNTGLSAKDLAHIKSEVQAYVADPLVHGKISVLTAINGLDAAEQILLKAPDCSSPLLLMHGTEDRICTVEGSRIVRRLEGERSSLIEWEGFYHEIHNEKEGREVLIAMQNWIAENK